MMKPPINRIIKLGKKILRDILSPKKLTKNGWKGRVVSYLVGFLKKLINAAATIIPGVSVSNQIVHMTANNWMDGIAISAKTVKPAAEVITAAVLGNNNRSKPVFTASFIFLSLANSSNTLETN